MTEKRYEAYYDKYMEDWKVQDILTLDILPCVSEKVAKEFENKLNNSYCANKKLLKSNDFLLKEIEQLKKENKKLKEELHEFKEYVFSDEKILCYSCVNCVSKGIYEVECSEKGTVDVHSTCFLYWKNEVKE